MHQCAKGGDRPCVHEAECLSVRWAGGRGLQWLAGLVCPCATLWDRVWRLGSLAGRQGVILSMCLSICPCVCPFVKYIVRLCVILSSKLTILSLSVSFLPFSLYKNGQIVHEHPTGAVAPENAKGSINQRLKAGARRERNGTRRIPYLASGWPAPRPAERRTSGGLTNEPPRTTRYVPVSGPGGSLLGLCL